MTIRVAVGVILNNSKVLIALRPKEKHKGGFWEFPGGKIELGETTLDALKRELKEEVGIEFIDAEPMTEINWSYSAKDVVLDVMIVREFSENRDAEISDGLGNEGQEIKWVEISDLVNYRFPEANASIVETLLASNGKKLK